MPCFGRRPCTPHAIDVGAPRGVRSSVGANPTGRIDCSCRNEKDYLTREGYLGALWND
jgi:hypothetical protein